VWRYFRYNEFGQSSCSKELMTAAASYKTSMVSDLKCEDTSGLLNMARASAQKSSWQLLLLTKHRWGGISLKTLSVYWIWLFKRAYDSCFFLPNIDYAESEVWRHFHYIKYDQSSCSKELMTAASAYQTSMRRNLKCEDTCHCHRSCQSSWQTDQKIDPLLIPMQKPWQLFQSN
jgi:hypothetical protein